MCARPVAVGGDLAGVRVQQVTTYGDCSMAVSQDGQLYGWGNSEYLQLSSVTEATQVRSQRSAHHNLKSCLPNFVTLVSHKAILQYILAWWNQLH